jgi:hypothetical protein
MFSMGLLYAYCYFQPGYQKFYQKFAPILYSGQHALASHGCQVRKSHAHIINH